MVAIPDDFLRSSVFLCVEENVYGVTERVPKATAVLIALSLSNTARVTYAVTARHAIYEARPYGKLFIRMNTKSGGFVEVETKVDDWQTHGAADVAAILVLRSALPAGVVSEDLDITAIQIESFVGSPPEYSWEGSPLPAIGPVKIYPTVGEELYFIGLFSEQYGIERNLPIARFGHISRMPSPIRLEDPDGTQYEAVAYLAEFHSWGGHSGSPAYFLHPLTLDLTIVDDNNKPTGREAFQSFVSGFIGIITGHYDIEKKATGGGALGTIQTALNSGIAVVTPAAAVRQLLMAPDVVAQRERLHREHEARRRPVPTMDFLASEPNEEFTREDFDRSLRRVSRPIEPSEPDASS